MDGQFAGSVIKIIIFLPMVVLLAYISLKVGGGRMMGMGKGRIIKIIEKVPLSNKSYLCVALINNKPYVIGCTEEKFEILMELPLEAIEEMKQGSGSIQENMLHNLSKLMNRKDAP